MLAVQMVAFGEMYCHDEEGPCPQTIAARVLAAFYFRLELLERIQ